MSEKTKLRLNNSVLMWYKSCKLLGNVQKHRFGFSVRLNEAVALVSAEVLNHASVVRSGCDSLGSTFI